VTLENSTAARLSPREGRRFGLTLGAAFLALAGVAAWRGHPLEARVFAALGSGSVALALLIPTRLGPVRRAWMAFGEAMSKVTTPLFLGVVYFGLLTPMGLLRRLASRPKLVRPASARSYLVPRASGARRRIDMERQF